MAFVPALPLTSTQSFSALSYSTGPARVAVATPARGRVRAPLRMCTPPPSEKDKSEGALPAAGVKTKAQEAEEEVVQTWQGNAWFAVIMGGMLIGVAATLARDFVDGGGPAVMM